MSGVRMTGWRLRALIFSILVAVSGYLAVSLWGGWEAVTTAVARVGAAGMAAALAMSLVNYVLRFIRWQMYLGALGHRIPWLTNGRIYLAGFALTTTPGKAGEAIRSVFLKRWGVGYAASLAAFLSERLSDLIAVVLLALVGLTFYPEARVLVATGVVAVVVALVALSQEPFLRRWHERSRAGLGWAGKWWHRLLHLLLEARRCHRPGLLAVGGGLGGAEAVTVSLLVWKGWPAPQAVAATVLYQTGNAMGCCGAGRPGTLVGGQGRGAA